MKSIVSRAIFGECVTYGAELISSKILDASFDSLVVFFVCNSCKKRHFVPYVLCHIYDVNGPYTIWPTSIFCEAQVCEPTYLIAHTYLDPVGFPPRVCSTRIIALACWWWNGYRRVVISIFSHTLHSFWSVFALSLCSFSLFLRNHLSSHNRIRNKNRKPHKLGATMKLKTNQQL